MDLRPHHPLCDFITELKYSDLPHEVAEKAQLCILDTLGAVIVGLSTPVSSIASDYAKSAWQPGLSTIFANGERRVGIAAAFANAVAANGTDIDDCGRYTWGHPGAQVVPTALALAEEQGVSGAELVAAVVIGYEVAFRAGMPSVEFSRRWSSSSGGKHPRKLQNRKRSGDKTRSLLFSDFTWPLFDPDSFLGFAGTPRKEWLLRLGLESACKRQFNNMQGHGWH